ncbi:MAG: molybdopterin-binding protein [Hyphomicrobiales bacterium]|nr:molybdopterin-binding protein [Hyphomicrobiales bacterium]
MSDAPRGSTTPQRRLTGALTPLDVASRMLMKQLAPVPSRLVPLAEAYGRYGAASHEFAAAMPRRHTAACDGWAMRASDLVGASSYAPVPLTTPLHWIEAGDDLPEGADCVVDPAAVDLVGPLPLIVLESFPGENIRRAGQDLAENWLADFEGRKLDAFDLLAAEQAGLTHVQVRAPRVALVDIPSRSGAQATASLIERFVRAAGADVSRTSARDRGLDATAEALRAAADADLILTIGGTGVGRQDHAVDAIERAGQVLAHGLALRPGRTAALGSLGARPVIALPGLPDQALAVWWALVEPVLAALSAARPASPRGLVLERKIASSIGLAEIVLLAQRDQRLDPLATGDLPLQRLRGATHVLVVGGDSEGCAPGTEVHARPIRTDLLQ